MFNYYIIINNKEKTMIFKYEKNKLKEYRKNGIFMALIPFCVVMLFSLFFIYLGIKDIEDYIFILSLTFIGIIVSAGIGLLFGYKKAKKEFESYQIECNDEEIIITSKIQHKIISIKKIVKIQKDNKNDYYLILNKINKIKIFHYLENIEEFEKYLNSIYSIEKYNKKYNIFDYIPVIFYFALTFISKYGNIELYIIFAFLVIITIIYSLIKLLINQIRLRNKIIGIMVYVYILCIVMYGLYNAINYLRN
jgi:hypothetical protein